MIYCVARSWGPVAHRHPALWGGGRRVRGRRTTGGAFSRGAASRVCRSFRLAGGVPAREAARGVLGWRGGGGCVDKRGAAARVRSLAPPEADSYSHPRSASLSSARHRWLAPAAPACGRPLRTRPRGWACRAGRRPCSRYRQAPGRRRRMRRQPRALVPPVDRGRRGGRGLLARSRCGGKRLFRPWGVGRALGCDIDKGKPSRVKAGWVGVGLGRTDN